MSDASLLVDPPSQRLSGTHQSGESAQAPPGLPDASPPGSVAGSNSIAVCRCGTEFPVRHRSDDLPNHPDPNAPMIRPGMRQICHGSGRRANVFAEA